MIYYLGVGTNLGDRSAHIRRGLDSLRTIEGLVIRRYSSVYETQACGGPEDQGDYYNLVLEIECGLSARELLACLKIIEKEMGRDLSVLRWSARPIDFDILMCDNMVFCEGDLIIPHPLMHERFFVLKPLCDLKPGLIHPLKGLSMEALLASLNYTGRWKKIGEASF